VTIGVKTKMLSAVTGGLGAMLMLAAPAMADPEAPLPAPAAPNGPAIPTPAPLVGPAPGPAPDGAISASAGALPTPPDGMPHLSSPDNLPPGTTDTPVGGGQPRTLGYLRDLWHAVQTQEVSGKGALLLLSQRPLDANSAPPQGMSSNPAPPEAAPVAPPTPQEPPAAAPVAPPVP
jgi:hypothetical protein